VNLRQAVKQLQYLLQSRYWDDDNTNDLVFGSSGVRITTGLSADQAMGLRLPFALIKVQDGSSDDEDPQLSTETIEIAIAARGAQDQYGESAVVGSSRTSGDGNSQGRGILEVERELLSVLRNLDGTQGIAVAGVSKSQLAVEDVGGMVGFVAARAYQLDVDVVIDPYFHPVPRISAVNDTGGQATLTWILPPDRWDRQEVILRRASGSTAPTSVTGGTGVTLASALPTTHADDPGAGTWSYAIFAGYDDDGDGTSDNYSAAATVTIAVT